MKKTSRTFENLKNHYEVEKGLAHKLLNSERKDRAQIYSTMYDDLFKRVPDHPRILKRDTENSTNISNENKWQFFKNYMNREYRVAEFAPGDCKFSIKISDKVSFVCGIDLSDQRASNEVCPDNFKLVVYDGFIIDEDIGLFDLFISDQLIEHIHPEDIDLHFQLVRKYLRENGKYVFRTPHMYSGPHDISKYFSNKAQGFHLKEYCFYELNEIINKNGFFMDECCFEIKKFNFKIPLKFVCFVERSISAMPHKVRKLLFGKLFSSLSASIIKKPTSGYSS